MKFSQALIKFGDWREFKVCEHTVVRYEKVLKIFCLCMHDPDIEFITLDDVVYYLRDLKSLGWQPHGILIVALALRKFFEFYNLLGYKCIDENLIPLPRKVWNIPRIANEQDYQKLLKAIPQTNHPHYLRNRALVRLIHDSYARVGEMLSLNLDDIQDRPGAVIKTEKSRGRRPIREIFWTRETHKEILRWIKKRRQLEKVMTFEDSEALFVSISKCPGLDVRGTRMTNKGAAEVFRMYSNRAHITPINAHSLRHKGGRDIIAKGGTDSDVSNILGHSNLESSQIYTMIWGEDLRQRWTKFHRRTPKKELKQVFHGALSSTKYSV